MIPKYPRTFHCPFSLEVHNDDKIHQNMEIFLNKRVIITEKIDGGCTGLFDGKVFARSTGQESDAAWFGLTRKHHAWKTVGITDKIFYGEDYAAIHSCKYDPQFEDEYFKLFHILQNNTFLSWDDVVAESIAYNFTTVPVLFDGVFNKIEDIKQFMMDGINNDSSIGGELEGFVMRLAESIPFDDFSNNVCKFVRSNHIQTDQHWKRNWQWADIKK